MSAFSTIAATIFAASGIWALTVTARMLAQYHDKMVAALLYQPIPRDAPIIVRRRA